MHEQSQWRRHWHCNMQICVQLWLTIIRAFRVNLRSHSDSAARGLEEGCRSLLKLLSLRQICAKISFAANDITQFITFCGCVWILIAKSLNSLEYGNTCHCCKDVGDNTVEKVCVWNRRLWLNDYGAGIKAFPCKKKKRKTFKERLLLVHRVYMCVHPTKEVSSERSRGGASFNLFPFLLFFCLMCASAWHRAWIDLWRFPACDISNRSSAPWLSWVNILASRDTQRRWCQLKRLVAIT